MVEPEARPLWWMECQPHIRALRVAMRHDSASNSTNTSDVVVETLLHKCVSLYMSTIRHNSLLKDDKVFVALSGGVACTAMEAAFMWLGGWRPTSALLLVYSLMGVQLEDEIRNFGYGIRVPDSGHSNSSAVLSHRQLTNLANVQKRTRDVEKKLSKKLAHIQMLISDQDVLAAVMVESSSPAVDLKSVLRPRMSRLKKLLIQADQLRLHTLHQLFLVLTPVQVARCAIAAFELAFMIRALGSCSATSAQHRVPFSGTTQTSQLPFQLPSQSQVAVRPSGPSCSGACSSKDYRTSVADSECSDD